MAPLPRFTCLVSSVDDLSLLPGLVRVGIDGFQVRDKGLGGRSLTALARRVLDSGAVVIVNDRLDVALAAGAHGVHLGATDLPVDEARRIAPDLLIGATCRNRYDVEGAAEEGADYAGVGPIFATSSKLGLPPPLGPGGLDGALGILPLIAIGGITATNVSELSAGVRVAVIGGIWAQPDPVAAAAAIVKADRR